MESISLLGVRLDLVNELEARQKCREFLVGNNFNLVATVNSEFIVASQTDDGFKKILNQASLCLTDAAGIVLMAKFFLKKKLIRLPGADFFWPLLNLAAEQGSNVYFLGGAVGAAAKTAEAIKGKYPTIQVAGFNQGPIFKIKNRQIIFNPGDEQINTRVLEEINQNQARVVFVAFGAPKQEYWINEFLRSCPSVKIAIGVGGTFDFIAGITTRAPLFLRRLGLEWCWRLILQPRRWKRIFNALIKFPFMCFNYYIINKLK